MEWVIGTGGAWRVDVAAKCDFVNRSWADLEVLSALLALTARGLITPRDCEGNEDEEEG